MKTYTLKMTSAVVISGNIVRAGSTVEVDEATAKDFLRRGKAELPGDARGNDQDGNQDRDDGPTVEEFVAAGYLAKNYPPAGYASRSTAEEIQAAIDAQEAAATTEQATTTDTPAATPTRSRRGQ